MKSSSRNFLDVFEHVLLRTELLAFLTLMNHKLLKQPPEVLYKNGVLKNFTKFIGKHPCESLNNLTKFIRKYLCQHLFFNKVADQRPATLFKKGLSHRLFPVNFVKFLRISFLQNTYGRLLLKLALFWFSFRISLMLKMMNTKKIM